MITKLGWEKGTELGVKLSLKIINIGEISKHASDFSKRHIILKLKLSLIKNEYNNLVWLMIVNLRNTGSLMIKCLHLIFSLKNSVFHA